MNELAWAGSPPSVERWGDFGRASVPELLVERVASNPGSTVIHELASGTKLTYQEFHDDVLTWAGALRGQGVAAGDSVTMILPNVTESYVIWLAISWLRGIPVPVNPEFRGNMLRHVLQLADSRIAIVDACYVEPLFELEGEFLQLQTLVVPDEAPSHAPVGPRIVSRSELFADSVPVTGPAPTRSDPSVVMFTGGTTGPSKGALMCWGNFDSYGAALPPTIYGENARIYSPWPVFHSSGHYGLVNAIYRNGALVLRDRFRTQQFWPDIRESGSTGTMLLGGVANLLWKANEREDDADNPLQDLSITPILMNHTAFEERFRVRVHTGWAMSETGIALACAHPLPNDRTCGRAAPGFEVRLVDENGEDVTPGVIGELWVKPADPSMLFQRYIAMPEATEAAWSDGWFHTGDAFVRDEDGFFYFTDRLKDCIRRRGENISSLEVEKEVNAHPDVLESAAVAVRDETGGEEVLVFVVCHPGIELAEQGLIKFLVPRMPRFMVPRYVELVDEIPKTPTTGRYRKIELRARGLSERTWDREHADSR